MTPRDLPRARAPVIGALLLSFLLILSPVAVRSQEVPAPPPEELAMLAVTSCGLAAAAFCESFDQPAGTPGNRSGDLNATLWGVSRATTEVNVGQAQYYDWHATNAQLCDGQGVYPDSDVRVCNGHLVEAVNDGDNGTDTILALYPKQPWDIAGRTGTVVFDVGDDTQGTHAAWPEFWYTDQPIPAPNGESLSGVATTPRNGFGVSFAAFCDQAANLPCSPTNGCPNSNDTTVDRITVVSNYVAQDVAFTLDGCLKQPTAQGQLNHFEVHLSTSEVQIFGTDAGVTAPLVLLAHASFSSALPLSRGLIWIEDVHYNACKPPDSQCDHAFVWDNVGFDGPSLPRDLTFDVPEPKTMRGDGTIQLGWLAPSSLAVPLTLTIPNVVNVTQASGAAVMLTFGAQDPTAAISYSLNGSPWKTQPWVYDGKGYVQRTIALPIVLSQVVTGSNTLRLAISQPSAVANVDLLLIGAGGIVGATPQPTVTPASPSPTASPSSTPALVLTTTSTATPSATTVAGTMPTSTITVTMTPMAGVTDTPVPTETLTPIIQCRVSIELNGTPGPYQSCL